MLLNGVFFYIFSRTANVFVLKNFLFAAINVVFSVYYIFCINFFLLRFTFPGVANILKVDANFAVLQTL